LLALEQRTADVAAASDETEVFQLMRSDFEAIMQNFPVLEMRLAEVIRHLSLRVEG
jgi:CRP-like cAMP-binding protein